MTILVAGASGATGRQVVEQILSTGHKAKVIVRSSKKLPKAWKDSDLVSIIEADILDITEEKMANHIKDCEAVVSCLGHNMTWKGIYGKPRQLVAAATHLLCCAINKNSPEKPVKVVLMNTAGNRNRDVSEPISFGEKLVIGALRLLLPPHADNEKAADYLREIVRKNPYIEWVVVRPDSLTNGDKVTDYKLYTSPIRSAIFNAGETSRINVGHFMVKLITDNSIWNEWKAQMPVIYNVDT